jgi:hypothetical protein
MVDPVVETYGPIARGKRCALLALGACALLAWSGAQADNFDSAYYDAKADQLVVQMIYMGTNPNHKFTLQWGKCQLNQQGGMPGVTAEILDDQFMDNSVRTYRKTRRFSLADMPCSRPASVTLHTAPRFFLTLTIPG